MIFSPPLCLIQLEFSWNNVNIHILPIVNLANLMQTYWIISEEDWAVWVLDGEQQVEEGGGGGGDQDKDDEETRVHRRSGDASLTSVSAELCGTLQIWSNLFFLTNPNPNIIC